MIKRVLLLLIIPFAMMAQQSELHEIDRSGFEIGKPGGRFVFATQGGNPETLNIALSTSSSTSDVLYRVYSRLIRRNQLTMEWEPDIAESWTISDDGLTATFKIRKGLRWSDGKPLTAYDFEYAVNKIYLNNAVECNYKGSLFVGEAPSVWKANNRYTLTVTVPTLYAGLLNISNQFPLPKHIFKKLVDQKGIEAVNSFWGTDTDVGEIVSYGEFLLEEYIPGEKVLFKKNPRYHERDAKGNRLPYLDELEMIINMDYEKSINMLKKGRLDLLEIRAASCAELINHQKDNMFKLYNIGPSHSTNFIVFNMNPAQLSSPKLEWLNNREFRLAIAHLIDRESMIKKVFHGLGYPQYSFVPRESPYYWNEVDNEAPKYSPDKAQAILDKMGYIDRDGDGWREDNKGNKINLTILTNAGNKRRELLGELFADEVKKIGIDLKFEPEAFEPLIERLMTSYDWELILIGLTGSVDPISGANVYPSGGNLHMNHPYQSTPTRDWEKAVDAAWIEANHTVDEEQRIEGFRKIQQIWIEENPWIFTNNLMLIHAYNSKLGNVKPQPVDDYEWGGTLRYLYFKE